MKHIRKVIAPVIITAIIVLYYLGVGAVLLLTPLVPGVAILIGAISVILSAVMISVLVERIKEIRSGEEDDLSQY
ncbi:MAG: hypothetical protein ACI4DN_01825 [Lachnospiraceae bacterium]